MALAHDRYCDEIAHQVGQLRMVETSGVDLAAAVPTCPDWSMEQLVRHVGGALRWVELLVRARAQELIPDDRVPLFRGPEAEGDPPCSTPGSRRPDRTPPCGRGPEPSTRASGHAG